MDLCEYLIFLMSCCLTVPRCRKQGFYCYVTCKQLSCGLPIQNKQELKKEKPAEHCVSMARLDGSNSWKVLDMTRSVYEEISVDS